MSSISEKSAFQSTRRSLEVALNVLNNDSIYQNFIEDDRSEDFCAGYKYAVSLLDEARAYAEDMGKDDITRNIFSMLENDIPTEDTE